MYGPQSQLVNNWTTTLSRKYNVNVNKSVKRVDVKNGTQRMYGTQSQLVNNWATHYNIPFRLPANLQICKNFLFSKEKKVLS